MKIKLVNAVRKAVQELYLVDLDPQLEHPRQESFGDYATSVALGIARRTGSDPLEVGSQLKLKLEPAVSDLISKIEVVEPGFLNFWLKEDILMGEVRRILNREEKYGRSEWGKGKTVVIDYSAPNIAKRFGVGHLRSTVIGQALYNLYQFLGYKTIGDNHLGDWGTQFGALLRQVKSKKLNVKDLNVDRLEELYVAFHREAEKNPKRMEEAREWFLKLESGDKEARAIWQAVVEVSLKEFDRIYALLGVKFDYAYGESFYEDKIPALLEEVRRKNLSKKSEGAEIVEFPNLPPAILVKSDGATTYFTRDLATIKYRLETWNPQKIIYEVGADQKLHFQQVFAAAEMLGWAEGRELVHVPHGLIRFAEGKMSTRRGQTIQLEEILQEAITRAEKLTGAKGEIARAVGVGAIKYFDLSHHPTTDIIFDWEQMFLLEGNSAPYLQYTYARANNVLRKAQIARLTVDSQQLTVGEEEMPLLRYIYRFPEVVEEATKANSPNLVGNYLFELSQRFNSFYAAVPIIKAPAKQRDLRLGLTAACAHVLKNGLTLLGIETPERL
uniref:Arginine--tRNA ligase n=1 Tax=candidate division WWE3 bacterium TaxID=2053526 RepID=A0A831Z0X9_UNCKA